MEHSQIKRIKPNINVHVICSLKIISYIPWLNESGALKIFFENLIYEIIEKYLLYGSLTLPTHKYSTPPHYPAMHCQIPQVVADRRPVSMSRTLRPTGTKAAILTCVIAMLYQNPIAVISVIVALSPSSMRFGAQLRHADLSLLIRLHHVYSDTQSRTCACKSSSMHTRRCRGIEPRYYHLRPGYVNRTLYVVPTVVVVALVRAMKLRSSVNRSSCRAGAARTTT